MPTATEIDSQIDKAQGLTQSLSDQLTPHLGRTVQYLMEDLEVLEDWSEEVDAEGVDALAGAPTVVETALLRVNFLQDEVGEAGSDLRQRLEELEGTLAELQDAVDGFDISADAYVTYVNASFAARYAQMKVRVGTILSDAGRKDVDELGLYPLDALYGAAIPDLAFPANREVNLSDEHRTYWQSESDGGSIA